MVSSKKPYRELMLNPVFRAKVARRRAKVKAERRAVLTRGLWVLRNCTYTDRKQGRDCNLTKEFVDEQLCKACTYCGETDLLMTLDRIDNSRGHTTDNVLPACIRCNMFRRDMPFEAWMCLVPGLRLARTQELFGSWMNDVWKPDPVG